MSRTQACWWVSKWTSRSTEGWWWSPRRLCNAWCQDKGQLCSGPSIRTHHLERERQRDIRQREGMLSWWSVSSEKRRGDMNPLCVCVCVCICVCCLCGMKQQPLELNTEADGLVPKTAIPRMATRGSKSQGNPYNGSHWSSPFSCVCWVGAVWIIGDNSALVGVDWGGQPKVVGEIRRVGGEEL